ncbi:hypothetical protein CUMW_238550 [Citrus unshiu]|uniref:Uncharacterized protein n=1 Tax=Citrus unshiu TaxID=55188 RepID=A0A2H5QKD6_CITUN|nr:hypothetical protein CUMW_238550 [Citrus unshiu]
MQNIVKFWKPFHIQNSLSEHSTFHTIRKGYIFSIKFFDNCLLYPCSSRFIFTCLNLRFRCHPRFSMSIIKEHSLFHIFNELEAIRSYMSFHMTKTTSGNKLVVLTLMSW